MSGSLSFLLDQRMAVHQITVTREDYEIDHGACSWRGEDCLVEGSVLGIGLHQTLSVMRLEEKTYQVRGWVRVSPATPNGPERCRAGVEVVDQ